jgi:hypothetical protein
MHGASVVSVSGSRKIISEGFGALHYVTLATSNTVVIEDWHNDL